MTQFDTDKIYLEIKNGLKNALSPQVFKFVWQSSQRKLKYLRKEKPKLFKEVVEYKDNLKKKRGIK